MAIFFSANIKGKKDIEVYTKLGELKEAIDGESIVEIMKKSELIEEKEPAISENGRNIQKVLRKKILISLLNSSGIWNPDRFYRRIR